MLRKALSKLDGDDKLVLHSDQGWQYQLPVHQRLLAQQQVVQSMSRKGNCVDNAAMESFFGTLKSEFFYLNKFSSTEQLRKGLADYIHYYNHDRIKPALKGLSPVQYRIQPLISLHVQALKISWASGLGLALDCVSISGFCIRLLGRFAGDIGFLDVLFFLLAPMLRFVLVAYTVCHVFSSRSCKKCPALSVEEYARR